MTITLTREEAQSVLDVLNDVRHRIEFGQMNLSDDTDAAIDTLRTRLAHPEPEPVAWRFDQAKYRENDLRGRQWAFNLFSQTKPYMDEMVRNVTPLYTAPPSRKEWQGLTDEEIDKALWENESNYLPDIIRIAEAKLKEKNS
jgi:hypothetical protein